MECVDVLGELVVHMVMVVGNCSTDAATRYAGDEQLGESLNHGFLWIVRPDCGGLSASILGCFFDFSATG